MMILFYYFMLFQLPYYIDGDIKITQSNAVSVGLMMLCTVYVVM